MSCLSQEALPCEIVIGDDSKQDATQALVAEIQSQSEIPLRYRRNAPRLGQSGNINSLFDRAIGSHLILLHDDDTLLPNAISDLLACWRFDCELTAAYGKQYVMSHDGVRDLIGSEGLNSDYDRSSQTAGLQKDPWKVGLWQQFPNDGYMIVTGAAKEIRWRSANEVGYGAEYDFGLRLGLSYPKFYFLNVYTACYRKTEGQSISSSRTDDAALQSYRILASANLPPNAEEFRDQKMKQLAPRAIVQALNFKRRREAWSIYWSHYHGWSKRISLGGLRRLSLLLYRGVRLPF
jgi:glycosyltransferase involved in cell wall biosynthesis